MRSAAASISSVVVRPLPHSRAMSRNGALVMPAMGASRPSALIVTPPMFMRRVYQEVPGGISREPIPRLPGCHRAAYRGPAAAFLLPQATPTGPGDHPNTTITEEDAHAPLDHCRSCDDVPGRSRRGGLCPDDHDAAR